MKWQQRVTEVAALVVITACALASSGLAQDCPELVGRVPGPAYAIAASNGYAYVVGEGLHVIDVSAPSAPVEVGFIDTPVYAYGVAVAGRYAYVADGNAGLRVIDVSTPSAPVEVGFVGTPGRSQGIAVSDGYAYLLLFALRATYGG